MKAWQTTWAGLVAVAGYVLSKVIGFLPEPPPVGIEKGHFWFSFGLFVAAVVIALMHFLSRTIGVKKRRWLCFAVALLSLAAAIVTFVRYYGLFERYTISVWNRNVLQGEGPITDIAKGYLDKSPTRSIIDVITDLQFRNDRIWSISSLKQREHELGIIYVIAVGLGTVCFCAVGCLAPARRREAPSEMPSE